MLLFEDRADRAMQPDPPWPAQRGVERLANQRVSELVVTRSTRLLLGDPMLRRLLERVESPFARQLRNRVEHLEGERSADHGRHRHDAARLRRQDGQTTLDRLPHAVRDTELRERPQAAPLGVVDGAGFDEMAQHLLDEERIALGFAVKRVGVVRRRCPTQPAGDHLGDGAAVEASATEVVRAPGRGAGRRAGRPGGRPPPYRGRSRRRARGASRSRARCAPAAAPSACPPNADPRAAAPPATIARRWRAGSRPPRRGGSAGPLSRRRPARRRPGAAARSRGPAARARPRACRPRRAAPPATRPQRAGRSPRRTADRRSASPRNSGRAGPPHPPHELRGRIQRPAASCPSPARRRSVRAGPPPRELPSTALRARAALRRDLRTGYAGGGSGPAAAAAAPRRRPMRARRGWPRAGGASLSTAPGAARP